MDVWMPRSLNLKTRFNRCLAKRKPVIRTKMRCMVKATVATNCRRSCSSDSHAYKKSKKQKRCSKARLKSTSRHNEKNIKRKSKPENDESIVVADLPKPPRLILILRDNIISPTLTRGSWLMVRPKAFYKAITVKRR